ncbi:hypothetical protein D3C80_821030 [compost metagenome]
MVATGVDDHVGFGRHVTTDTLGARAAGDMVMMRGGIVVLGLQGGEAGHGWVAVVALQAQPVALDLDFGGVGIVAVGAANTSVVHFALRERAVLVHLTVDLAIGVVKAPTQCCREALVELRMTGELTHAKGLPPAVAERTLLDHALAAQRLVIDSQPYVLGRSIGLLRRFGFVRPIDMRLARPMATLAANILLLPGGGEAVLAIVVLLHQAGGMAIGAHAVPVLVPAGPVQRVIGSEALPRVEREPALPALALGSAVPGDGQSLQAASGQGNQVLLQRIVAEGVENLKVCRLAILTFGIDEEATLPAEETRRYPGLIEASILEVAEHVGLGSITHGPAVIRVLPGFGLGNVTAKASSGCHIALGRDRGGGYSSRLLSGERDVHWTKQPNDQNSQTAQGLQRQTQHIAFVATRHPLAPWSNESAPLGRGFWHAE